MRGPRTDRGTREDQTAMTKKIPWSRILDWGWVILIAAASSLLVYYQWREQSFLDGPDVRAHYANALEWIRNGVIPDHGQGLSYSGYGPPGTAYLMLPGVLLGLDPRLADVPGAVLLHFGTLLFVFLIVRETIGRGAAWAAVPLAGFLSITGPTLWPNGHPFFVVGMLYCLLCWVRERSAHWFSAALLLAGLGMYVYFTIAPALIAMAVIALIALIFRRPLSIRSLAATLLVLFVVWLPFLRFEAGRDFVDLRIMLLRQDLESDAAPDPAPVYCFASLPGESDFQGVTYMPWTAAGNPDRVIYPGAGRLASLELSLCTLMNKLDRNFDSGFFLSADVAWPSAILFGLCMTGWMLLAFRALSGLRRPKGWLERLRTVAAWKFLLACGIGIAAISLLAQPAVVGTLLAGDPDWDLPGRLLLTQIRSYGILIWISTAIGLWLASRWEMAASDAGVLAVMIGICGILLLLMTEIERPWRFWWLWALQSIAVAAALGGWLRARPWPRWMAAIWIILSIVVFFPFRTVGTTLDAIRQNGYGGRESGQVQVMEWLAEKAGEDPLKPLSIGVARYGSGSEITAAWGWLEFGLKYIFPAPNAKAADLQPEDGFRVVEFRGDDRDQHPAECPWDGFEPAWVGWRYTICQRQP
jgi:hypothetical protein